MGLLKDKGVIANDRRKCGDLNAVQGCHGLFGGCLLPAGRHGAIIFIIFLSFLSLTSQTSAADECATISRTSIINFAKSGVSSPYVWGGDKWDPNNRKWAGADCSGFVAKAWQVPKYYSYKESAGHPYNTYSFKYRDYHWYPISRTDLQAGDALVYDDGKGNGHSVIFEKFDNWATPTVYEARGKAYGIIYGARYFSSNFVARRRHNLTDVNPTFLINKQLPNQTITQAAPGDFASSLIYMDLLAENDSLHVRNSEESLQNNVNISSNIDNLSFLIDPYLSLYNYPRSNYKKFIEMKSNGKVIASRQLSEGSQIMSVPFFFVSKKAYLTSFRLGSESLYIDNIANIPNVFTVTFFNDTKIIKTIKKTVSPRTVLRLNFKNQSIARKLKASAIQVDSSKQGFLLSRRTNKGFTTPAMPAKHLAKSYYFSFLNPATDTILVSNPGNKSRIFTIDLYKKGKLKYRLKRKINQRDLVKLSLAGAKLSEAYGVIYSKDYILAERQTPEGRFYAASPPRYLNEGYLMDRFNPTTDNIIATNPNSIPITVTTSVISGGKVVSSDARRIRSYDEAVYHLRNTSAVNFTDAYLQFSASF